MLGGDTLVLVWLPLVVAVAIVQIRRNASFGYTLGMLILATYTCALIAVTLFPLPVQPEVLALRRNEGFLSNNFLPFKTVSDVLTYGIGDMPLRQLGGNFLLLVPLTFLLPALWKRFRSFRSSLMVAAAVSFSIEFLQFAISAAYGFTYKVTDIDDPLLNISGATIGFGIYTIITRIARAGSVPDGLSSVAIKGAVE